MPLFSLIFGDVTLIITTTCSIVYNVTIVINMNCLLMAILVWLINCYYGCVKHHNINIVHLVIVNILELYHVNS